MRLQALVLSLALSFSVTGAGGDAVLRQADFFTELSGDWQGTLTYLDYQSETLVELPATLSAELTGDGYLITQTELLDPGQVVRSLEVSTFEFETGRLVTHTFAGGSVQREVLEGILRDDSTSSSWQLTFLSEGTDNGRAAELRATRSLEEGVFRAREEVHYKGEPDSDWFVRNELVLERTAPDSQELMGDWQVDLRPTPDAAPYFVSLRVTEVGADGLKGTFYDTPITDARVNVDWGSVRFAFVTEDGTGVYHTSGLVMPDGTLSGTTHSLGRDFLSVWTAIREE